MSLQKYKGNGTIILIKFLFYYFKIFGIATLSFEVVLNTKRTLCFHFKTSKASLIYNILLIFSSLIMSSLSMICLNERDVRTQRGKFDRVFYRAQETLNLSVLILISIVYCIRQNQLVNLTNKINGIWGLLLMIDNNSINNFQCLNNIIKILVVNILMWIIAVLAGTGYGIQYFPFYFGANFSKLIITALFLQYIAILKLLQDFYRIANNNLQVILYNQCVIENLNVTQEKIKRILIMHDIHVQLDKIALELSNFYEKPMLFCLLSSFTELTCSCYVLVEPIFVSNSILPLNQALHTTSYGILYITLLTVLTKSATAITTEVILSLFLYVFYQICFVYF